MVELFDISDNDLIKYRDIFKRADVLFGWNSKDAKKILKDGKESILFCYHPMYMVFSYDDIGKLIFNSCVANDEGQVVSITIDGYQINVSDDSVYLIDENGMHQSLSVLRNDDVPNFDVSSNGLVSYMQYDSKKDIRLVLKYEQVLSEKRDKIYVSYLTNPFSVSVESKPKLRDSGLIFLGKKDVYYRLDFNIWNNRWQYDLATLGEYGVGAVMAFDTVSLHNGEKEFSRYYKQLFSIGNYVSVTLFPFGKAYKRDDIELIIDELNFNKGIPLFVGEVFNCRNIITDEFQQIVDAYSEIYSLNKIKK